MTTNEKKNIVWLASYPKSGNTWFRAFLTALLSEDKKIDINNLSINRNFCDASLFEHFCDQNASELSAVQRDELMPEVMNQLAKENKNLIYIKVHEHYRYLNQEKPIIPSDYSKVALYFIRNPLDVAVSFAHHNAWSFDTAIHRMSQNWTLSYIRYGAELFNIPEQLGSWSEHTHTWTSHRNFPVEVIRYEDMHTKPLETFQRAIRAIGLSSNMAEINDAIHKVHFDKLQAQEQTHTFKEKNIATQQFFRRGKIGSWREELNRQQIQKVIDQHADMMRQFGYLE